MVLDFLYLTDDKEKEVLIESQNKRFAKKEIVEECEQLLKKWKEARGNQDTNNMNKNKVQKEIGQRKKANKSDACEDLLKEKAEIEKSIEENAKVVENLWTELTKI
jgi:seryl-tRNA synthetase